MLTSQSNHLLFIIVVVVISKSVDFDWVYFLSFVGRKMSQWCHLYWNMVFVMLLMTMELVESHATYGSFDMVEPGQSIKGKIGSQQPARRNIECSSM